MKNLDARFNRRLSWLVAFSLLIFVTVTVFRLGLGALPYDATDTAGHPAGFNDTLYPQHYLMMVQLFRPASFFRWEHFYEWLLLAMHLAGLGLLLVGGKTPTRWTRGFFALQPLIFPWGVPLLFTSLILILTPGSIDRETWVDMPSIQAFAAPVWVWLSIFIAWKLRGERLGWWGAAKRLLARRGLPSAQKKPLGARRSEGFGRADSQRSA